MINALNSGADVFMADFEDSCSPTWTNIVEGQINCLDANNGVIEFQNADGMYYGKSLLMNAEEFRTRNSIALNITPIHFQ